jgi:hypothetical protein
MKFKLNRAQVVQTWVAVVAALSTCAHAQSTSSAAPAAIPAAAPVSAASQPVGVQAVGQVLQNTTSTPIRGDISAQKVVRGPDGKDVFSPATNLVKGDVIQFSATFTNNNAVAIRFDPQIAIPPDTELVAGSIKPPSGKLVKTPAGTQTVVWTVPSLPPRTWVVASMRVRYTREVAPPAAPTGPASAAAPASATSAVVPPAPAASQ